MLVKTEFYNPRGNKYQTDIYEFNKKLNRTEIYSYYCDGTLYRI